MQSFGSLNRKKIPFIFGMISSILIGFFLLLLLIVWLVNGDFPGIEGMCIIILVAGIPMPVFLLFVGFVGWYLERWIRIKALKKAPFDKLNEIGFVPKFIGADTAFSFTEEMLEASINGYRVQFNVNRDTPKKVEFIVFVEAAELSKERYNRLKSMFKKENVFFDFYGLIKKYDLRKISNLTIDQVEKELIQVIEVLKAEGFEPRMD